MADFIRTASGYSSSDFTGLADYYMHKLSREFKCLHTKEEYTLLKQKLEERIEAGKYDAVTTDIFNGIYTLFKDISPDSEELGRLNGILMLTPENKEEAFGLMDALSKKLKSENELDSQFLETLYQLQGKHLKGGGAYIRRLVIRRLREISPEFVCARDENGEYLTVEEGAHAGERALLENLGEISTRLLILKQIVKQFGWGEGVPCGDKSGRAFQCHRLKEIIGERNFGPAAESLSENVFEQLNERLNERGELIGGSTENNLRLVRVAKNIGSAFFQRNWNTREDLYVFAIAFEMTWNPILPEVGCADYETDIRKNLFYDFYSENLLDLITMDDSKRKMTEGYITGYGINYKNFMEAAYLFALSRKGMSALQKLREARGLIEKLTGEKPSLPKAKADCDEAEPPRTQVCLEKLCTAVSEMDSEQFLEFLKKEFTYSYDKEELLGGREIVKIYEYGSEMRTADAVFCELTDEKLRSKAKAGRLLEKLDLSLFSTEKAENEKDRKRRERFSSVIERFNTLIDREATVVNFDKDGDEALENDIYYELILRIREGFGLREEDLETSGRIYYHKPPKTNAEEKDYKKRQLTNGRNSFGDKIITRSTMLISVFNFLILKAEADSDFLVQQNGKIDLSNFGSFYSTMSGEVEITVADRNGKEETETKTYNGINRLLVDCGYMEISPKNVFDLLLIYSAYKRMFKAFFKPQTEQIGGTRQ